MLPCALRFGSDARAYAIVAALTFTFQTFLGMRDYIHKDVWVNNGTGGTDVSQETLFPLALNALS